MKEAMINMSRWTRSEGSDPEPARHRPPASTRMPRRWAVSLAALATVAGVAVASPAVAAASTVGNHHPSATAATSGGTSCPTGDTALVFDNDSGQPNTQVFGAVVVNGTITPTPGKYLNNSVPFSTFPAVAGQANAFYFCMVPGDTAGRLWISIGTKITGLPSTQPAETAPYRFGYVEFTYPGTIDYSNVNDFDFPVDLQTYTHPGDATAAQSSIFSGNTCQIVNAMKSAVQGVGGAANWAGIEKTVNGQFVRIISPDSATYGNWPSMKPYIENFAKSLPTTTAGTYGPITVQDYYVVTPHKGWFKYTGYFNRTTYALTLTGTVGGTTTPGGTGSTAGTTMTVTLTGLARGIYDQGHEYKVNGVAGHSE